MRLMGSVWSRFWRGFQRFVSPGLFMVIVSLLVVCPFLFGPVVHGYADNGDFWRVIYSNGMYPFAAGSRSDYFAYLHPQYHIMQYFNEHAVVVHSSQTLFVKLAQLLNGLLYSHKIFDIRFMGIVNFALYLGALYLLTVALTHPVRGIRSYIIALMVVFVFDDSAITLYMNSFFAEPGGLTLLLYAVAAILLLSRNVYRRRWPLVTLYFVSSALMVFNKQQNAPLALSMAVVTLGLLFIPQWRRVRPYIVGGIAAVLLTGVVTFALISKQFNDINMYQTFTYGVLVEQQHPGKAIAGSGINRQYALMRNGAYNPPEYASVLPTNKATTKHLTSKLSTGWVVAYYIKHPQQFMALMDVAAKNLMVVQVGAVGDYPQSAGGSAQQQAHYFTGMSTLMRAFYPRRFAFNILLAVVLILVFSVGFYADIRAGATEGVLRFMLVLGLLSILIGVPIVSVIGDGTADLAKHMFLAPMSLEIILVILVADALNGRLWHAYREGAEQDV